MRAARAASRRFLAGLAVSAGGLLAAACVSLEAQGPKLDLASMASAPAPRSTLVTRPGLRFHLARGRQDGADITVLVHETSSAQEIPVAVIASSASQSGTYVSIQRLGLGERSRDAQLNVAV